MKKKKLIVKEFKTELDFQNFLAEERDWLHDKIYETIKEAVKYKQEIAKFLLVKIEDKMVNIEINSTVEEWDENLSLCIDHYAQKEDYEKCGEIKNLKDKINGKSRN